MKTSNLVIVAGLVGLFSVSVGGAATYWMLKPQPGATAGATASADPAKAVVDTRAYQYISLDKVIVMLRNATGEPVSHYVALDLVFMTPADNEKVTRDHLPLLRSVAVKALSQLTMESASRLTIDELTQQINDAYAQTYADDLGGKPFAEAMISKLIIE